jgi:hypothetical protein
MRVNPDDARIFTAEAIWRCGMLRKDKGQALKAP